MPRPFGAQEGGCNPTRNPSIFKGLHLSLFYKFEGLRVGLRSPPAGKGRRRLLQPLPPPTLRSPATLPAPAASSHPAPTLMGIPAMGIKIGRGSYGGSVFKNLESR